MSRRCANKYHYCTNPAVKDKGWHTVDKLCASCLKSAKERSAVSLSLPKCSCGQTASKGYEDCSACRELKRYVEQEDYPKYE